MKNVEDIYPLTPTQAGMLVQSLREDDPELYFEQVRTRIAGPLDPARLKAAFDTVTERHPVLRTAVVWDGLDRPVQAVRGVVEVPWEEILRPDWTVDDVTAFADQRRQLGFDFTKAPLQRVAVITIGAQDHHLLWEFNHIICDGWSAAIVLGEVLSAYNGAGLTPDPPPFREYLAWHGKQDAAADLAYWTQLLSGFVSPSRFALPPASSDSSFRAGQDTQSISGAELDALLEFGRDQRITLNTLVQAAWAIVQSRYSGVDDVVFGVTSSGRPADLADVERIVGMFLTTLPLRVNTNSDQSVSAFLADLQGQQQSSGEHGAVSLAELHRMAGVPAGQDLFDTVMIFENFPKPATDPAAELEFSDTTVFEQTNYPLTLMVGLEGGRLEMVAHFDRNRFTSEQAEAFMAQFASVLLSIVEASTVADLAFYTQDQLSDFMKWQGIASAAPPGGTVTEMLLEQARQTPLVPALIHGADSITFAELIERARDVAAMLSQHGVRNDVLVGIAIPRSIDMVVAIVGTLLAGGAYLPMDPKYPAARLQLMVEAAGAPVVLTNDSTRAGLPAFSGPTTLTVGSIEAGVGASFEPVISSPDDTMLVTFTSGSTGAPKGVRVHHAGVVNRCTWQWNEYPLVDGEVFAHKTTLSFVDHLWEIWGGLLQGHAVLMIDDEVVTDVDELIATLGSAPIRRISLVPSLLDVLLDHEPNLAKLLPTLVQWSVSGEALSVPTANRFLQRMPDATLINLYGMSEASQDATFAEIRTVHSAAPIGRPIANMAVDLVDDQGRLVPVGVPGNLRVLGVGLSPGYWQQPDLTAERFITTPGGRAYMSGDVARWRSDGLLEYLGRSDDQVKVRGVRIELGEIETALASHPAVDRAVAVGRTGSGGTQLCAYALTRGEAGNVSTAELVDHLAALLPPVMVPSTVRLLETFPVLPNGKVDRSQLPDPGLSSTPKPDPRIELSSAEEEMLGVWRKVMDYPDLGPDDDFFAAGGHSMLAMQLASKIKTDLNLTAPLAQLLRSPTPRALVAALAAGKTPQSLEEPRFVVPLLPADPSVRTIFVFHGAGGDVLNFRDLARHLTGRLNVVGVQAAGVDGIAPLHTSAEQMVKEYLEEIRSFQPDGPYLLAGFSIGGRIAVEVAQRLVSADEEVGCLVLFDTYHPSLQPRPIPLSEHVLCLFTKRGYGVEKLRERLERRRMRVDVAGTDIGGNAQPVPFKTRKRQILANLIQVWKETPVTQYDGSALLLAAEAVEQIWDQIPADRGWSRSLPDLQVVPVGGDHLSLVEDPFTAELASKLLAYVDRAGP